MEKENRLTFGQWFTLVLVLLAVLMAIYLPFDAYFVFNWVVYQSEWKLTWYITGIICLVGLVLYWIRENLRLLYGIVELVAAVFFIRQGVLDIMPSDQISPDFGLYMVLQIATPVYVFVRGLDNVGVGLREWERTGAIWNWMSLRHVKTKKAEGIQAELRK